MVTDGAFSQPSDRQARFHAELETNDVYQFVFAYRGNESYSGFLEGTEWMGNNLLTLALLYKILFYQKMLKQNIGKCVGCFHSAELPYVFGYPLLLDAPDVRRDSKIFVNIFPYNQQDKDYAEFTHDLWTNFAKFG